EEMFFLVTPTGLNPNPTPGPIATLASPTNGGSITLAQINAQRYIDITYTSLNGSPIDKNSLNTSVAPFKILGPIADLANTAGRPTIIGTPLVVSGQAATSTTVTYRYFLKDSNTSNTTGLFSTGAVTIQFDGTWRTVDLTVNVANLTASFTIDPSAPGEATTGGPI